MVLTYRLIISVIFLFYFSYNLKAQVSTSKSNQIQTVSLGFGLGATIVNLDKQLESEEKDYFNGKIEMAYLSWPHNFNLFTRTNFNFDF